MISLKVAQNIISQPLAFQANGNYFHALGVQDRGFSAASGRFRRTPAQLGDCRDFWSCKAAPPEPKTDPSTTPKAPQVSTRLVYESGIASFSATPVSAKHHRCYMKLLPAVPLLVHILFFYITSFLCYMIVLNYIMRIEYHIAVYDLT